MVIFSQTLSDPEHTRVLKEARRYATGLHISSDRYPVGETAVPSSDPNWNYNDPEHIWERDHFLICVKAGLKAAQQKEPHCLSGKAKRGPQKFTNLDLDFYEGQVILKDKFLSQCALATLQHSPMAHPESLNDKARGKCLICRQEGHWAKECPNPYKSPKTACHKCHQLGHWVALCPGDPRASRSSAKPSLTMVQQD